MAKVLELLEICDPNVAENPPVQYYAIKRTDGEVIDYSNCHERWFPTVAQINRPGCLFKTEQSALTFRGYLVAGGEGELPPE